MKSFISHITILRFFVSIYILTNFFKHGAHPYTQTLRFITQGFNPSFYMNRIQQTRHGNRVFLQVFTS
jgi:hypothetical protein